jgi:outer membrane protein assembly factor BamA
LPVYLGYPWLIRGYENISVYNTSFTGSGMFNYTHLSGSKAVVGNLELRLPFTGPKRLSMIESKWLLSDLNLFFDGGVAWNNGDHVKILWNPEDFNVRTPVFSAGASMRINVLGAIIVEPYYAIPFQNGGWNNRSFGLNFLPGW